MKAYLFYNKFYDFETHIPTIGGIQTYICDLSGVLKNKNYQVSIVQSGFEKSEDTWNECKIIALENSNGSLKSFQQRIREFVHSNVNEEDIVVYMTHTINCMTGHKRTISIQHGIYWDVPNENSKSSAAMEFLRKTKVAWININRINACSNCVAVDYNFLNWYKTQQFTIRPKITVIPNYSDVSREYLHRDINGLVKILFARRFEKYRGTRIFANAIQRLIDEKYDLEITFAGTGPDEEYLQNRFNNNSCVRFIKYNYGESLKVHEQHDIAVVASIGSEGTSLSLLEAMGAGCAVVATNVGGLTNILINKYNGMICDITSESLYTSIKYLLDNPSKREDISKRGYETVISAFNKTRWKQEWEKVIDNICM